MKLQLRASSVLAASGLVLAGLTATTASAQVTLNTTDRGSYSILGTLPGLDGYGISNSLTRSYFVFDLDLPLSTVSIDAASLTLWNPDANLLNLFAGGFGGQSTEIVGLWDVSTPVSDLVNSTGNTVSTFADLGSGVSFGAAILNQSTEGTFVTFELNTDFLTYVNSLPIGSTFAIGASLLTDSRFVNEFAFAGSATGNAADGNTSLDLLIVMDQSAPGARPVPEPSTYGLMGAAALAGLVAWRRRARR